MLHDLVINKACSKGVNGNTPAQDMAWSVTACTTKLATAYKAGELHRRTSGCMQVHIHLSNTAFLHILTVTHLSFALTNAADSHGTKYLCKARLQQPVGGFAHQLLLLSSSAALRPPAVKGPVQSPLSEVAHSLMKLVMFLQVELLMAPPPVKGSPQGAVCEVGESTLRFGLLVL